MTSTADTPPDIKPHLCLMQAELTGGQQLYATLSEAEATQAFEQAYHRLERAISSFNGHIAKHIGEQLTVHFNQAEDAWRAACDMQMRIDKMPAVSGIKLAARIAFHWGSASGSDASPEVLQLTSRLFRLVKDGQILTSQAVVDVLPPALSQAARHLKSVDIPLHGTSVPVYAITWSPTTLAASHPPVGVPAAASATPLTPSTSAPPRLQLFCNGQTATLDARRPLLTLGRDLGCDLCLASPQVSRQHARIEWRDGSFILIDQSTNGTWVVADRREEHRVHGTQYRLPPFGQLRFGPGNDRPAEALVRFFIVTPKVDAAPA